jgi:hypothetical protein
MFSEILAGGLRDWLINDNNVSPMSIMQKRTTNNNYQKTRQIFKQSKYGDYIGVLEVLK